MYLLLTPASAYKPESTYAACFPTLQNSIINYDAFMRCEYYVEVNTRCFLFMEDSTFSLSTSSGFVMLRITESPGSGWQPGIYTLHVKFTLWIWKIKSILHNVHLELCFNVYRKVGIVWAPELLWRWRHVDVGQANFAVYTRAEE